MTELLTLHHDEAAVERPLGDSFAPLYDVPFELFEILRSNEIDAFCREQAQDLATCLLDHMAKTPTGYPEDMVIVENGEAISNHKASPTNIGLHLASLVAIRDMEFVSDEEADRSIDTVLTSLEGAKTHQGLFYNWYDTRTGDAAKMANGSFISTVDNAWLAVGLMTLKNASPAHAERSNKILGEMNFPLLYDETRDLFYGGYNPDYEQPTNWHYDILNTEGRIASYVGISNFGIPPHNYKRLGKYAPADKEVPDNVDKRQLLSWGGSMFEALMPTLFVNEGEISETLASSHNRYIEDQIKYGEQHDNGFWGYSPCYTPDGEYCEFGVDELSIREGGYGMHDVVTPHAIFLSLPFMGERAVDALQRVKRDFPDCYQSGLGFVDSVNVKTGKSANARLSLDQSMSLISLYNYLTNGGMTRYFSGESQDIASVVSSLDN